MQVDEVQDTHLSEYEVVKHLAMRSGNLAFVGDTNQTIYEWRGSQPGELLARFEEDFAPVQKLSLEVNYRATKVLVKAANSVASRLREYVAESPGSRESRSELAASSSSAAPQAGPARRTSGCLPSEQADGGERICIRRCADEDGEARWISRQIERIARTRSIPYSKIGVLTRTNPRGMSISEVFSREGLPHVTVEQFRFFERMEIKDALACLKIIGNPRDKAGLTRVLLKLAPRIGDTAIADINSQSESTGLALSDLVLTSSYTHGDPFHRLIEAWDTEGLVVLDVETTDMYADIVEVVEVAATRIVRGEVIDTYSALLRNTVPVGPSESIHGYSDAILKAGGRSPREVFGELFRFVGGAVVAGHNAQSFDLPVIASHMRRLGMPQPDWLCYDTLDLAQRFVKSPGYSLAALADTIDLRHKPTHRALDDVRCTCDLLSELMPQIRRNAVDRQRVVLKYAERLKPFAALVDNWRIKAKVERPPELLREILETSGLRKHYSKEPNRLSNLDTLYGFFCKADQPGVEPWDALQHLIKLCAISTNVDLIAEDDDRVPVITVHQAKGLEFDYVFIATATDGQFPHYLSTGENRRHEEARIFYVAVTRARKQLFITYPVSLEAARGPLVLSSGSSSRSMSLGPELVLMRAMMRCAFSGCVGACRVLCVLDCG